MTVLLEICWHHGVTEDRPTKKKGHDGQDAMDSCCKDSVMQKSVHPWVMIV